MFFMIGIFPKRKLLKTLYLNNPVTGILEEAQIIETGNQLVFFFIPIFTFSRQYVVLFPSTQTVCAIEDMDKDAILEADRMSIQNHLKLIQQGQSGRTCPYCHQRLEQDFAYCPYCGRPL